MVHVQFKIDNINMKKYKLGDFLDNYGDGIHGTPKYDINGDYYFINGSNLGNGKIVINDDTQKVSAEEYTKIRRPIVNGQTILVSINGTLGKIAIYHGEKIGLGKSACFLNLKEAIHVPFIFAILMTKEFKTYLHNIAGQSTIKNVSPNQIANYEFYAPSSLCDCIAYSQTILKINEKIELNRQINDNLEAMAKQLYDYWFVQFDFPNEEGKPYKSSGGAMAWNERLKREIPIGWTCCSIKEMCDINKKTINKDEHKQIEYLDTGSITQGHISNTEIYSVDMAPSRAQRKVEDLSILYSSVRPRLLHYGILSTPNENFIVSTGFVTLDAKCKKMALMVYYFLTSNTITEHLASIADTAVSSYPSISPDDIAYLDIVIPSNDNIQKYNDIVEPMFRKMSTLRKEIDSLTKQRDELLPLLMNGQASVNYHLSAC